MTEAHHHPALAALVDRVRQARADKTLLDIRGGDSKAFYGGDRQGEPLDREGSTWGRTRRCTAPGTRRHRPGPSRRCTPR